MSRVFIIGQKEMTEKQTEVATFRLMCLLNNLIFRGYKHFAIGLEDSIDYLAAEIITKFKQSHNDIFLEAIVQDSSVIISKDERVIKTLKCCSGVGKLNKGCVLNQSEIIIGIWDGNNECETYNMLEYAKLYGKEIHKINI